MDKPLAAWLLTEDPAQRLRLKAWWLALLVYLGYTVLAFAQVALGFAPLQPTLWLGVAAVVANAAFYIALRSGWNQRFKADPSLSIAQLAFGLFCYYATYALAGQASGAVIIISATHVAYSMFGMTPQQVRTLVVVSLGGLAVTMALCAWLDPQRHPPAQQLVTFGYACVVLPLIARLAGQVAKLHERLRSQRSELKEALARVQELAIWDDLTQVHNRRHLLEQMRTAYAQAQRSGAPLCLALLDIDLFKNINDRFGHAAGDEVLRRFAAAAKAVVRTSDLLGRWGGEEFMAVFPATPSEPAQVALQRLREQLQRSGFDEVADDLQVNFSAGLVQVRAGEPLEAAIERADQALYRAKTGGRNRTELG